VPPLRDGGLGGNSGGGDGVEEVFDEKFLRISPTAIPDKVDVYRS